jgi:predicted RNase H-like nuclease (RuvC/YqgF family)
MVNEEYQLSDPREDVINNVKAENDQLKQRLQQMQNENERLKFLMQSVETNSPWAA